MTWGSPEAAAAPSSTPQQQSRQTSPRVGWDLTLYPRELNIAFWHEQASRYANWDSQVAWVLLVMVGLLSVRQYTWTGARQALYAFYPAWVTLSIWLTAMRWPAFYRRHRVPLLSWFKVMLMYQTLHATNTAAKLLYIPGPLSKAGSPLTYVLTTTVLITNVSHLPSMCAGLPLPFVHQLAWLVLTATAFFFSQCPTEMVSLTNVPLYLQPVHHANSIWAKVVQSSKPPLIQPHDSLRDRSHHYTLTLLTVFSTAVAANLYLAYIIQWIELRLWLREKVRLAAGPQQQHRAQAQAPAQQEDLPVFIDGCEAPLTQRQLHRMAWTSWTLLLLDGKGVLGRASMFCLHACIINLLCLGAFLLSQVLGLRLGPRLLPAWALGVYYPLQPHIAGDVCGLGDQPQYQGWFGAVLRALQG